MSYQLAPSVKLRVELAAVIAPYVFFIALFPAYFAYHALLGVGLMVPVLGGGWSVWTISGFLVLAPIVMLRLKGWRIHAPALLLAAWVSIYALAYFLFGAEWQRNPLLLLESMKLVSAWGCLYAIGYLFRPHPAFTLASFYALCVMAIAALFLIGPESLHNGPASYLGFATSIVFVTIFCLALAPVGFQPLVIAAGLAGLFALGSRADFLGLIFVIALWGVVHLRHRRFSTAAAGILAGALALAITAAWTGAVSTTTTTQGYGATRQLELIEFSKSQSLHIRIELLRKGWADIKSAPLLGVYGGQMRDGSWGNYIHMALSAWRQFGLLPFLLYVILCAAPAIISGWQTVLRKSNDPLWTLTLLVGAFTMLQVTGAKSVFWAMPALATGLLVSRLQLLTNVGWWQRTTQATTRR